MSFVKFECQSLKWARFGSIADHDCYIHFLEFLFWLKVEPLGLSCHAFMAFLIGLFIPLRLSTGNSFKSFGKALVTIMVSKPERTYVLLNIASI